MILPFLSLALAIPFGAVQAENDDAPIPYDSPESDPEAGKRFRPQPSAARMAGVDDPDWGLRLEAVGGLMLVDSSRGTLVDPTLTLGARLGWNMSRAFSSAEESRYSWYLETLWLTHSKDEGTKAISTRSAQHLISLAPAYALHFDRERRFMILFQAGGGIALQDSTLQIDGKSQNLMGVKPLIQYGLSFLGKIPLNEQGSVSLSIRLDAMRFRRGYLDDTALTASTGLAF